MMFGFGRQGAGKGDSVVTEARIDRKEAELYLHYLESQTDLYDRLVSFDDEFFDGSGREVWSRIGLPGSLTGAAATAYTTESELSTIREQSRWLALHNEFAINGHENRVSYVVGQGHVYRVEAKVGQGPSENITNAVRDWLDRWLKVNKWAQRQQETAWRRDRDGEAFYRYFPQDNGMLLVRFVEPEKIRTPESKSSDESIRFGIKFADGDAETPVGYFVNGDPIDASEIQRRTMNVDLSCPRGIPTFYPVRKNLKRAERLLCNLGHMAGIRAAIGWIEKHKQNKTAVQAYLDGQADVKVVTNKGKETDYRRYLPGSVLHKDEGTDFEWPPTPDLKGYVTALQAELRAVASRLVMPEFMLTSDASNANYSSTMVAEGPAVKMFERLQSKMIEDDEEVIDRGLRHAAEVGLVPAESIDLVKVVAEPPRVRTRNRLEDTQADQVLDMAKVLSKKTFAARHELNFDDERENMEDENERETGFGVIPRPRPEEDG